MKYNCKNVITLIQDLISNSPCFGKDLIDANFQPGNQQLLIITGENATGKSFVRRLINLVCRKENIELLHFSQQAKSSTGIISSMIYGDESYNSTGSLSAYLVTNGIKNCNDRTNKHYVLWDEPEMGLSDRYCAGMGNSINQFVNSMHENTIGSIIITHSKALTKQLLSSNPSHLRLGNNLSLQEWINEEIEPSDLEELQKRNNEMFNRIQKILKIQNQ